MRCFSVRVYELNGIQENSYIKLIFQVQGNLVFKTFGILIIGVCICDLFFLHSL